MEKKVSVIIPVFNEEKSIEATINGILNLNIIGQIIIVDDCSTDQTIQKVQKYKNEKIELIHFTNNKGKGAALRVGVKKTRYPIIIFLDGDIGDTSKEILKLAFPLFGNYADVTIGMFPPSVKKGGFGCVKLLARKGVYWLTGNCLKSVLSGQRGFKRKVLQDIKIPDRFGVEFGMTIDMLDKGFIIKEVPVKMKHSETGRNLSGFYHRGKQFRDILRILIHKYIHRLHHKIYEEIADRP